MPPSRTTASASAAGVQGGPGVSRTLQTRPCGWDPRDHEHGCRQLQRSQPSIIRKVMFYLPSALRYSRHNVCSSSDVTYRPRQRTANSKATVTGRNDTNYTKMSCRFGTAPCLRIASLQHRREGSTPTTCSAYYEDFACASPRSPIQTFYCVYQSGANVPEELSEHVRKLILARPSRSARSLPQFLSWICGSPDSAAAAPHKLPAR